VAFDGVGSMPMARIREVRSVKQAVVDVELARRDRSRAVRDAVADSERHAPFVAEGAQDRLPYRKQWRFCSRVVEGFLPSCAYNFKFPFPHAAVLSQASLAGLRHCNRSAIKSLVLAVN
jgi:hypothetical protein